MAAPRSHSPLVVGVDTGGTFTDIVYRQGSRSGYLKLASTPDDPAAAVIAGLRRLFAATSIDLFTYGTTVATNAMLERRGVRTALVTTRGFEDVIEIGRQARPDLYDLEPQKAEPLVPRPLRLGADERCLFDGRVERPLSARERRRLAAALRRLEAESVAVCLLHSTAAPAHELALEEAFAALGIPVTLSHRLSPVPGEYERSSTAVANAYVGPKVARHLRSLAADANAARVRVMQSNGGAIGVGVAADQPVRTMLSGPAGGVAAAHEVIARLGIAQAVTLDMGGTSTDVAFLDGALPRRADTWIGGFALRVPCLDIHTVGAGGGSIARVDEGGALRVGPESAGADPGPACYGKGSAPTVTDANVVLGRLPSSRFLGGQMALDADRSRRALAALAREMNAPSLEHAADGVLRVVEANMERAIRTITVERGHDPRDAVLVAFGGAAGLHACGLAAEAGFREVLIPEHPGLLSAIGVREGNVVFDRVVPLRRVDPGASGLQRVASPVMAELRRLLAAEGVRPADTLVEVFVRARYLRQSIELEVALAADFRRRFDEEHRRLFHGADPDLPLEVVGLRVSAASRSSRRRRRSAAATTRVRPSPVASVEAFWRTRRRRTPVFERDSLAPGARIDGPAIVSEYSSTTSLAPGWRLEVDEDRNLRLKPPARGER